MAEASLEMIQGLMLRMIDEQRAIRGDLQGIKTDLLELRERVGFLEGQASSISRRLDRMGGDVEQIKRRLDLVDAS